MAQQPYYEGGNFTAYVEAWDGEISTTKPTTRPHEAWITDPAQVTAIVTTPGAGPNKVFKLYSPGAGEGPVSVVRDGEWRVRPRADDGPGKYFVNWEVETADGYRIVSSSKVTVKARPDS